MEASDWVGLIGVISRDTTMKPVDSGLVDAFEQNLGFDGGFHQIHECRISVLCHLLVHDPSFHRFRQGDWLSLSSLHRRNLFQLVKSSSSVNSKG